MIFRDPKLRLRFGVLACVVLFGCAPRPGYRILRPVPPRVTPGVQEATAPPPVAKPIEPAREPSEKSLPPVLSESSIQEQSILGSEPGGVENIRQSDTETAAPQAKLESTQGTGAERVVTSTRPADTSLVAMITPETHPRMALSLRLAENGRSFLEEGEPQKALAQLEKAISIDSRNRYAYYYLAKAHYVLEHHKQSLNFLEIMQSYFTDESAWRSEVLALQGKNYQALGFSERADEYYIRALSIDPENQNALEGITRIDPQSAGSTR